MKAISAIVLSVLFGLFIGGRVGRLVGGSSSKTMGAIDGICAVADAAVAAKVLSPEQAEKLGSTQAQTLKVSAKKAQDYLNNRPREGDICRRIVNGIAQATK